MKTTRAWRRALSLLFAVVMLLSMTFVGTLAVSAEEATPTASDPVAKIGDAEYATLAEAITAVKNGETITLYQDCAEMVTVKQSAGKSFTVDGNGKTYTGTITIDGASNPNGTETLTFTNFVFNAANSITGTKTSPHNVTFDNCTFITVSGYNVGLQHLYNWSFINCKISGSGAFMQVAASPTHNLYVENLDVEISSNLFKIDSCTTGETTATFKDVEIRSAFVGFYISNRNTGAIKFENVSATCHYPIYIWDRGTGIAANLVFEGENIFTATEAEAWLTAKDGTADVSGVDTITVAGGVAKVGGTQYRTFKEAVEAAGLIEGGATVTLLEDVTVSEPIAISGNVTIVGEYTVRRDNSYTGTLFTVSAGASLTLDGGLVIDGGNNYTFDSEAFMSDAIDNWNVPVAKEDSAKWFTPEEGAPIATAYMITTTGGNITLGNVTVRNNYSVASGVVSAGAGSTVTLSGARITHVAATQGSGVVVNVSGIDINVTVNEGTVIDGNHVGGNHGLFKIYSGAVLTMNGGEIKNNTGWNSNGVVVGVYKGSFYLNGGTICSNAGVYGPANGRNAAIYLHTEHTFVMTGGTICHNSGRARGGIDAPYDNGITEIYGGEVLDNVSRGNGSEYDVLGTDAMQIYGGTFTQDVSRWLAEGVGLVFDPVSGRYVTTDDVYEYGGAAYDTFDKVIVAIKADSPATAPTVKVLANHRITTPIVIDVDLVLDLDGRSITSITYPAIRVQGDAEVSVIGDGSIKGNDYVFVLGSSDGESAGYLTIESGSFRGVITVASVTKGTLTINGGTFRIDTDETYNYQYLLNCIDASYRDGSAVIVVNGGSFYNFNPESNAAEGAGTNFLGEHSTSELDEASGIYTVGFAVAELNGVKYKSFEEALAAAVSGDVIVVYKTVVITTDGTVDLKGARVNAGATLHGTPVFRILADVTFKNGIVDGYGAGSGSTDCYAFIVGNSETAGTLTIDSGTYRGITSAISITQGVVNIKDGTFQTSHDGEGTDYGTSYLLNCIDSAYKAGTAKFNITGGKFVGFNPESNAAEGAGTNFLADGYKASDYYDNDKWYVARANVVLDGDKYFATIKDALAILTSADTTVHTLVILEDIEIDVNYSTYNYPILINGFVILLDLNGKTVTADWSAYIGTRADNALIGICNGGKLTIIDSVGGGKIVNNDTKANVENRIFWVMTGTATKELILNIEGGTFVQNDQNTALLYIQGNANNSNMGVYVNITGGHFETVNTDFFNAYDGYKYEAWITGGTFNKDPRDNEIRIPDTLASYMREDGTWGITEAVAYVGYIGYATLGDAVAAAPEGAVVELRSDVTLAETVTVEKSITIDLGGYTVDGAGVYPAIRVKSNAELTVKNGTIINTDYVFVLGASDGTSAGYLTIESGTYRGYTTLASVTKGKLVVLGGEFSVYDEHYGNRYLLNCIDASYLDGTAVIEVKGGRFLGFNPESNAAEGAGTNFLTTGYVTYDPTTDYYTVHPEIRFRSSNLLLGNTIGIYFNLNTADLIDGVNYVAVFTIHGTEYVIPRYNENGASNWVIKSSTPDVTRILFEGIAAKEMTVQVSVTLYLDGKVVSNTVSDSVKSYVERGIASGVFTAEDMDLVIQMLNYGSLAQQSFGYNTDDLADSGEHVQPLISEYERPDGEYVNSVDATHYYGASLNLENNIGFNFKFYKDGLETATVARVTYVNHTGRAVEITVPAESFGSDYKLERDIIVVHVGTLVAADARQMLHCELLDSEGNVLAYANDSIESYCARAIAGLSAMPADVYDVQRFKIEFYQALMKYSMAAYDYDPDTKK